MDETNYDGDSESLHVKPKRDLPNLLKQKDLRILLIVTGSVAAVKLPLLYNLLKEWGVVKVLVSEAAEKFILSEHPFKAEEKFWFTNHSSDEIAREVEEHMYDAIVIAPLSAHRLSILANCNLVDNDNDYRKDKLFSACWHFARGDRGPLIIAPAMNTMMWTNPLTADHCKLLLHDCPSITMVGPISKRLACNDVGIGAMATPEAIVEALATSCHASSSHNNVLSKHEATEESEDKANFNILVGVDSHDYDKNIIKDEVLGLLHQITLHDSSCRIKIILQKEQDADDYCAMGIQNIRHVENVFTDMDEWRTWKKMGDPVLHIELRKWADILVVVPLSNDVLDKFVQGRCDSLLTNVFRAWDFQKPVIVAPRVDPPNLYNMEDRCNILHYKLKVRVLSPKPSESVVNSSTLCDTIKNYKQYNRQH